jgi:hypothetical protein
VVAPKRLLIVEGEGSRNHALKIECREAFTRLQERAGVGRRKAKVMPAGGRKQAYDVFCSELQRASRDDVVVLLVDAEDVITAPTRWGHVRARTGDGWERPAGATEDHLHFMAVIMETWLLADPPALQAIVGPGFDASKIPAWPKLEDVPKAAIYDALRRATHAGGTAYDKGAHSFKALARVDAAKLEAACPSALALFEHLRR